nr:rna polymerase ii transcription factor b subunit 2 [Quercus suber]
MDEVDVMSFLFTLGSLELGVAYSTSNLTPTQKIMLDDLADFGLVYRPPNNKSHYFPTRLATTLTSDSPALPNSTATQTTSGSISSDPASTANEKGYIILETNYRLYAYTSTALPIAILSLFSSLQTRYPNLITARLTKQSTLRAISTGIRADQIISYLVTHAHPILRAHHAKTGAPILPPTVVDQIRLWEREGNRMDATPGFLIKDLASKDEYLKAVAYAEALGVLKHEFPKNGWFFVTRMDQMKGFFAALATKRKEAAARAQAQGPQA